ncbi:unnamed protein product [Phaedon cochleariae]|uniref:Cyclin-C n=1 Tax=Phaedon cochleariae TaxID=80249 RepID=A0A9N9SBI2_PHACE|nr:unnamed protein product [Phaedon cochleariae]
MNFNVVFSNKLLIISSAAALLGPYYAWKYFISVYKSLRRQYDEEVIFHARHDCVVMYTGSKGMSGWPPYKGRIVPDITNENCLDVLYEPMIYFINTAEKSLDVACMMIGINKIFEALIVASKKGVKVRMLLNREHVNNTHMLSNVRECIRQGIEVQMYISHIPEMSSIMHYKFIVKDHSESGGYSSGYLFTGSMNINRSAVMENYEDIVFSSDQYVVKAFHENFEKCFRYIKMENESLNQQWLLDKQDLIRERQHDLAILQEDEYQKIFIFFSSVIQTLGEQLKLRQQVIATATVYFKRFYARNSLKCIDPLLLAPTCIFLASKVEEFGVISNSRLITTCQTVIKNKFGYAYSQEFPYRTNHILECEFYLLENLDCCLIVYQPYRPLLQLIQDIGHEEQLLTLAWRIVNDSLRTDVSLLYPPYQIAIGCLQIACVILQKDHKAWFAELNVDIEKIQEIARYIINLFELWKTYDEKKEIQGLLGKMPKPKPAPQR